ncbi:hypothetical protein L3Q82_016926 [Scortum barcoo]|uniref:Uncharacterized protein n=1 Tax=Scortum barcoo TaxID=214431 RepID=A0ACB8X828_9TELE|nr:hypothetical protein L3Q82_016926 [Scortum barcoo]
MRFSSWSWNTGPALYTLRRVLEGLWEFAQPVHMCFVDLEKAFDHVSLVVFCGECSVRRCSRHVPPGGGPGEDPGHAGETMSLSWPGNASGVPPEELEEVSGVREVWASLLRLLPPRPGPGLSG